MPVPAIVVDATVVDVVEVTASVVLLSEVEPLLPDVALLPEADDELLCADVVMLMS